MKRAISFIFAFLLWMTAPTFAGHVDSQTAQHVAEAFLQSKMDYKPTIQLIDCSDQIIFTNLYVFGNNHCFVIISADNCIKPVLGYSTDSPFLDENQHIPTNAMEWIKEYDKAIDSISKHDYLPEDNSAEWNCIFKPKDMKSVNYHVEPLIKTRWDQWEPYNALCPNDCPAGCTAVAMAQLMNYWKNPTKGVGCHYYTPETHPEFGEQSAFFGITTYDWDNMPDYINNYSPQEEIDAVSTLIYHCGVSLDTDFSYDGSGGSHLSVKNALQTYFQYDSTCFYRYYYPHYPQGHQEWISLLKNEINAYKPIIYCGWGEDGGAHAFICDGYDDENRFHFNWGWGGSADGYFLIDSLNPHTLLNTHSYNETNWALFGCLPNIAPPIEIVSSINDGTVSLFWKPCDRAESYNVYRNGEIIANGIEKTTFVDCNLPDGVYLYSVSCNYYGKESDLSKSISITIGNPETFARIADNNLFISADRWATLQILDIAGKRLFEVTFSDNYEKRLSFSSGIYILRLIRHNGIINTQKIVIE